MCHWVGSLNLLLFLKYLIFFVFGTLSQETLDSFSLDFTYDSVQKSRKLTKARHSLNKVDGVLTYLVLCFFDPTMA